MSALLGLSVVSGVTLATPCEAALRTSAAARHPAWSSGTPIVPASYCPSRAAKSQAESNVRFIRSGQKPSASVRFAVKCQHQEPLTGGAANTPVIQVGAEQAELAAIPSLLTSDVAPIDLASALRLAGVRNNHIVLAQQRVLEASALQQLAAAQILPNINAGTNYDAHTGSLQQASGNILKLNRNALYIGAGANAVAAGSVNLPGLQYNLNVSDAIYSYLVSRQITERNRFASAAIENDVMARVAVAYTNLARAQGQQAIAVEVRSKAREVARITANYAHTGEGRAADAERAATELARRDADVMETEADVLNSSARLIQELNLESNIRLHATDGWIVPRPIVPDPIPLPELIATAMLQRPELADQNAAIRAAFLNLNNAKLLPFSPQLIAGYSTGAFGGGSDLVASSTTPRFGALVNQDRFSDLASRSDTDVVLYWSLRNLGIGNKALVNIAQSRLGQADLERLQVLNRVRAEVVEAYAISKSRQAQLDVRAGAVRSGSDAYKRDLVRIKGREGLPIELLDSLRLHNRAEVDYLNSVVDFNTSQIRLYKALGAPVADALARPVAAGQIEEIPLPPEPKK